MLLASVYNASVREMSSDFHLSQAKQENSDQKLFGTASVPIVPLEAPKFFLPTSSLAALYARNLLESPNRLPIPVCVPVCLHLPQS